MVVWVDFVAHPLPSKNLRSLGGCTGAQERVDDGTRDSLRVAGARRLPSESRDHGRRAITNVVTLADLSIHRRAVVFADDRVPAATGAATLLDNARGLSPVHRAASGAAPSLTRADANAARRQLDRERREVRFPIRLGRDRPDVAKVCAATRLPLIGLPTVGVR